MGCAESFEFPLLPGNCLLNMLLTLEVTDRFMTAELKMDMTFQMETGCEGINKTKKRARLLGTS